MPPQLEKVFGSVESVLCLNEWILRLEIPTNKGGFKEGFYMKLTRGERVLRKV
jgi:hypothetical protein